MTLERLRSTDAFRTELHRQAVDQPSQLPLAGRLLDQALLRGAERFGPIGSERECVETELRVERCRLVGEQALQMLRLAAGNRRFNRRNADAAVDAIAGQQQPPGAQVPLLQLANEI